MGINEGFRPYTRELWICCLSGEEMKQSSGMDRRSAADLAFASPQKILFGVTRKHPVSKQSDQTASLAV
jgi:hypothetical protein